MRVKILVSFVGRVGERKYRMRAGDEITLPEGADWVRAGLAEPIEPPAPEEKPKASRKKKAE